MKFYLSSYKIGDYPEKLLALFSENKRIDYIPNALDFTKADAERRRLHIEKDMQSLQQTGLHPELLDLKEYFEKKEMLKTRLSELGGLFISGGNTFVLRQAMKLSGLDSILINSEVPENFVYAGYSAAGCVLSSSLEVYAITDDATDLPYKDQKETIWEGLHLIEYALLPHFESNHPESEDAAKELQYCITNSIPYRTIKDGEALIIK
ncbi:MAG: Type 1 glutamine amidotransferase-like domain-containing protein [Candidatus Moraniibacteriota bacterium]